MGSPSFPHMLRHIQRLNRLLQASAGLLSVIQNDFPPLSEQERICLIDSMPVMTADARRIGKTVLGQTR